MCNLRFIMTMLLLVVLVAASDYGEAASNINMAPTDLTGSAYSITATELPEAAGIDLSISYDTSALEAPQVKSGDRTAGAMMEQNGATPGLIRVVFITAGVIKGSGELASVTFTKKGNAQAPQPKLSTKVYAASGTQLAVQSTSGVPQAPIESKGEDNTTKYNTGTASITASGGSAVSGSGGMFYTSNQGTPQAGSTSGTISSLQDPGVRNDPFREDARKEERREEPASVYLTPPANPGAVPGDTASFRETAVPVTVPDTKSATTRSTLKTSQSVLERFRTYKDIRTVKRLSTLFDESVMHAAGIVQSPEIVVADGKSLVTVSIDLLNEPNTPSFSLKGANLKSIRQMPGKKWELDALPQKGKSDVRLTIILNGEHTEIPLVVVPSLNQMSVELSELSLAALDELLAKPLKNNKPAYDLNSDGKQDYLDDYILIAHWLLKQQRDMSKDGRKPAVIVK